MWLKLWRPAAPRPTIETGLPTPASLTLRIGLLETASGRPRAASAGSVSRRRIRGRSPSATCRASQVAERVRPARPGKSTCFLPAAMASPTASASKRIEPARLFDGDHLGRPLGSPDGDRGGAVMMAGADPGRGDLERALGAEDAHRVVLRKRNAEATSATMPSGNAGLRPHTHRRRSRRDGRPRRPCPDRGTACRRRRRR